MTKEEIEKTIDRTIELIKQNDIRNNQEIIVNLLSLNVEFSKLKKEIDKYEKTINILKNSIFDFPLILSFKPEKELTKEEYDLLKEVLKYDAK